LLERWRKKRKEKDMTPEIDMLEPRAKEEESRKSSAKGLDKIPLTDKDGKVS